MQLFSHTRSRILEKELEKESKKELKEDIIKLKEDIILSLSEDKKIVKGNINNKKRGREYS